MSATLNGNGKARRIRPALEHKAQVSIQVPYDEATECAALGCVFHATCYHNQSEADELLLQLKPRLFFDTRHRTICESLTLLRMHGHATDPITVDKYLRDKKLLEQAGGAGYVLKLPESVPSVWQFPEYLQALRVLAHRRWLLSKSAELAELATSTTVSVQDTQARLAELFDATHAVAAQQEMIDLITPEDAIKFQPDEEDYLIGDGLISRETFITFGGEPGSGKSRMLTTLAVAGARGSGHWLSYPVRRCFRSVILQTENTGNRLKEELSAVPESLRKAFHISRQLPRGLAFGDPEFRRAVLRLHEKQPFDVLGIDPWNDVVSEEGQSDYAEALANIRRCFTGRKMPAVVIVAHLRKMRSDSNGRRKNGRELLHELSGSLKLGSTSRTVFAVQPATSDMDDDRVIVELAKANDVAPEFFRQFGKRSAWHRGNAIFEPCQGFDWDEWLNPSQDNERRAITLDMVKAVLGTRPGMKQGQLVKGIAEKFTVGESTVWRAIKEGSGYLSPRLYHAAGVIALAKGGES